MKISEIELQAFEISVEQWILDAIENGASTFEQLIKSLPSVDPIFVLDILQKTWPLSKNLKESFYTLITSAKQENTNFTHNRHQKFLPPPHPLDYDWRFTDSTIEYLLQKSADLTPLDSTLILLGTPSLLWAGDKTTYKRNAMLLEANTAITNCLSQIVSSSQIVECDLLRDTLPNVSAESVIMDPPWYPEYIKAFLWDACHFCQINGHVLVSLPPIGTRPGIEREWNETLVWANLLGLKLIRVEELSLSYLTPLFEHNAFRVKGIYCVPQDWRRGNLAIFVRSSSTNVPRPIAVVPEKEWLEVNLDSVRVRVRPWDNLEFSDPRLFSVIPNDILTSVSRRDPRRQLADVWTSGNRIFSCQGKGILWQVLDAVSRDCSPYLAVETMLGRVLQPKEYTLVSNAVEQVFNIINIEQKENLLFGDYWNSTNFAFNAS